MKDTQAGIQRMGKRSTAHKDAKLRGLATSDVGKLRQTEMKGTRGTRPVAGKFGDKDLTHENLEPSAVYDQILKGKWKISEQPQQSPDAKWRKTDRWQCIVDENAK